jgi:hypothetical protein
MLKLLFIVVSISLVVTSSEALVLCQNPRGAVRFREACRTRETQVDSALLASATSCAPDSERVGTLCIDKFEASVWQISSTNGDLITRVQAGAATLAELQAAGAVHLGVTADDYGAACPDTGSGCTEVYAVSVMGASPSRFITWFQAAAACRNSDKRLLTNAEWQVAALGTPDPGSSPGANDCNTNSSGPVGTGQRTACESDTGIFDAVGNVWEWVADWGDMPNACTDWTSHFPTVPGDDFSCVGGPGGGGLNSIPLALVRGGGYLAAAGAGVLAIAGQNGFPLNAHDELGFRCGR